MCKFIRLQELSAQLQQVGFNQIDLRGFNLLGETISEQIAAYRYYRQTDSFRACISGDLGVMYIGKAVRLE